MFQRPVGFPLAFDRDWLGLIIEAAMTFGLVYTFYATTMDPRKSHLTTIAPLAMGFFAGANILVGGPFHGASMNPARAFGPALVGWRWTKNWIYWVGPLVGGGLGAITYEYMVMPSETPVLHHCIQQSCTSSWIMEDFYWYNESMVLSGAKFSNNFFCLKLKKRCTLRAGS